MTSNTLSFNVFTIIGVDAEKFLQGQVTVDVRDLTADEYRPTAICDLKGRINFGLWLKKHSSEHIDVVVATDQADALQAHIKKYGAFSKIKIEAADTIYPTNLNGKASFSTTNEGVSIDAWQSIAISQGQAWITAQTAGLFQPQELRLHQRGGVDYDKGCYLGQEIIARLWFKAKPKHWLHLIHGTGDVPAAGAELGKDIQVVNSIAMASGWQALVVAKPEALAESDFQVIDLPEGLNGDVGREK